VLTCTSDVSSYEIRTPRTCEIIDFRTDTDSFLRTTPLGAHDLHRQNRNHRSPAGEGYRVSQPHRSPRHDDRTRPPSFPHVWCVSGIRAQLDPRAHRSGSCCCSARRSDGRPSAKTNRRRHRGCQGDAGQPRHRHHPNRAPPRCLTGDALSAHPGRANSEYAASLTTAALPQRPVLQGGSLTAGGGSPPIPAVRAPERMPGCLTVTMSPSLARPTARGHYGSRL
jgi:hypothetical protein